MGLLYRLPIVTVLVGGFNPSEKKIWKNEIHVPNHQPGYISYIHIKSIPTGAPYQVPNAAGGEFTKSYNPAGSSTCFYVPHKHQLQI